VWRITVSWNVGRLVVGYVRCVARIQDSANIRAVGLADLSATVFVQYLGTVCRRRPFPGVRTTYSIRGALLTPNDNFALPFNV
jgi:hypothetical protein